MTAGNMQESCHLKAYAKINLGLDVVDRLPNGYHEVRMIMQTVDICDELTMERAPSGIMITTDSGELPTDENNLIYKAVKSIAAEYGLDGGVRVHLQKRIPIAAGMAGGSTDAAAALRGMNELFGLNADRQKLMDIGVRIGADVPYCVMGGTALAEGIGEKLTPLPAPPDCFLVVAKPDIHVSTQYVYEHLDAAGTYPHPDIDGMMDAIRGKDLREIAAKLGNVLECVTVEKYPIVGKIKELMMQGGALGSLMSGSGPTVFGIYDDPDAAAQAARLIGEQEKTVKQIFVTGFVDHS